MEIVLGERGAAALVGKKVPGPVLGKVNVSAFVNGWGTGMNLAVERARRAAAALGDKVVYRQIDTSDPAAIEKWGSSRGFSPLAGSQALKI